MADRDRFNSVAGNKLASAALIMHHNIQPACCKPQTLDARCILIKFRFFNGSPKAGFYPACFQIVRFHENLLKATLLLEKQQLHSVEKVDTVLEWRNAGWLRLDAAVVVLHKVGGWVQPRVQWGKTYLYADVPMCTKSEGTCIDFSCAPHVPLCVFSLIS